MDMQFLILTDPPALILFCAALILGLYGRIRPASGGCMTILSAGLAVLTAAYSLLTGASLLEVGMISVLFFLLNVEVKS